LVALVLIAVVVVSGLGYWLFVPKTTNELVTYTTQQASFSTTSEQTLATSTMATAITSVSETTLWIDATATKPVSYYVSLLKSSGTQPYVQLGWELQALPDATNATAVAKITYLALNATNPEVKDAFELMMKGGTPSPSDFTYTVPNYNTELQILYWLACQNEFKKDDTLALAIAMVNGLWVTMGDNQVGEAVRNDTNSLLRFGRQTSEWEWSAGLPYNLENYPLEAKIAWAWTGTATTLGGPYGLIRYSSYHEATPTYRQPWPIGRLPIEGYEWNRMSVATLRIIQDHVMQKSDPKDVNKYIATWEDYFFGGFMGTATNHWTFVTYPDVIPNVNGVDVRDGGAMNIQYQMKRILNGENAIGDCGAETALMDAFAKAVGIASLNTWRVTLDRGYKASDAAMIYYDPQDLDWKIYSERIGQTMLGKGDILPSDKLDFWIYKPPTHLPGFLRASAGTPTGPSYSGEMFFALKGITKSDLNSMLINGVPTSEMKEWLFYS